MHQLLTLHRVCVRKYIPAPLNTSATPLLHNTVSPEKAKRIEIWKRQHFSVGLPVYMLPLQVWISVNGHRLQKYCPFFYFIQFQHQIYACYSSILALRILTLPPFCPTRSFQINALIYRIPWLLPHTKIFFMSWIDLSLFTSCKVQSEWTLTLEIARLTMNSNLKEQVGLTSLWVIIDCLYPCLYKCMLKEQKLNNVHVVWLAISARTGIVIERLQYKVTSKKCNFSTCGMLFLACWPC